MVALDGFKAVKTMAIVGLLVSVSIFTILPSMTSNAKATTSTIQNDVLLTAGSRWAAGNGNKALYVDGYDNYLNHAFSDGSSWDWMGLYSSISTMIYYKSRVLKDLQDAGFNVTCVGDIPKDLSPYNLAFIWANFACSPSNSSQIRTYIQSGGGVVIFTSISEYLRTYSRESYTGFPTDPLSINNSEWLGFNGYQNAGGIAKISVNHPFGTDLASGQIIANTTGWDYAGVTGTTSAIMARWSTGVVFACSNQFGQGRVYYQATWDNQSVDVTSPQQPQQSQQMPYSDMGFLLFIITIVAILAIALILLLGVRHKPKGATGPNPQMPYEQAIWRCDNCGAANAMDWYYCPNCGRARRK